MSGVRAENVKFFDEVGINLQMCNPTHGHAERGNRAVEVVKAGKGTNHTLRYWPVLRVLILRS